MNNADHIIALLKSHIDGDSEQFFSVAMQAAAKEAREGHVQIARTIKELVGQARERSRRSFATAGTSGGSFVALREDLLGLVAASEPSVRLSSMVLPSELEDRLERVVLEHRQRETLLMYHLSPRRKLLLVGPPGTGKTMTARSLAGELKLPLLTVLLEGVISKFMGETATKLKQVFDAMETVPGVYFFDEFDAIGAKRNTGNDVGEIRRVLNSFLQFLENDRSDSLIVAATNHPELLDTALYRRFDDVIEYSLPNRGALELILRNTLVQFDTSKVRWGTVLDAFTGLSQADAVRLAVEAAKRVVLGGKLAITAKDLLSALKERSALLGKPTSTPSTHER